MLSLDDVIRDAGASFGLVQFSIFSVNVVGVNRDAMARAVKGQGIVVVNVLDESTHVVFGGVVEAVQILIIGLHMGELTGFKLLGVFGDKFQAMLKGIDLSLLLNLSCSWFACNIRCWGWDVGWERLGMGRVMGKACIGVIGSVRELTNGGGTWRS